MILWSSNHIQCPGLVARADHRPVSTASKSYGCLGGLQETFVLALQLVQLMAEAKGKTLAPSGSGASRRVLSLIRLEAVFSA